jgi:hypothetical protein
VFNQFDKLFPLDFVHNPGAGDETAVPGFAGNDCQQDRIACADGAETMNDENLVEFDIMIRKSVKKKRTVVCCRINSRRFNYGLQRS